MSNDGEKGSWFGAAIVSLDMNDNVIPARALCMKNRIIRGDKVAGIVNSL